MPEMVPVVNQQVLDAIHDVRSFVTRGDIAVEAGAGKAYQFVAQATALAVQDATDNLRNISTVSATAIGVAMTQMISSGDVQTWKPVVEMAQGLVASCAKDFRIIGDQAAAVLKEFQPLSPPPPAAPLAAD